MLNQIMKVPEFGSARLGRVDTNAVLFGFVTGRGTADVMFINRQLIVSIQFILAFSSPSFLTSLTHSHCLLMF